MAASAWSIGFDPSLRGFGLAAIRGGAVDTLRASTRAGVPPVERWGELSGIAVQFVRAHQPVAHVAMESVLYSAPGGHLLAELGAVVRFELWQRLHLMPRMVTPAELKRSLGLPPGAGKERVGEAVAERWGVQLPSHDEADAYVLARLAEYSARA